MSVAIEFVRDSGLSFIEQLQKMCEIECEKQNRPYLTGKNHTAGLAVLMRPPCKCWGCAGCCYRNARRWIARIINGCNKMDTANGWQMFTLTAHEKWRKAASVKNLRQGWKKLYNRMRYEFGISSYVKVWEMHEDTTFHLHGLIDSVVSERWLKDNSRECGMGYEVEIHPVDNAGQVAGYIAKYFLKSEANVSEVTPFPKNLRRIEVSRNWLKLPKLGAEMEFDWIMDKTRHAQNWRAEGLKLNGFQVLDFVRETPAEE